MNPSAAKQLLVEGGTFVILGVPEGTEFGIDMKMWNTGENFRGIKMIPPGIHFIHYSPIGKYGEVEPKVGFFYNFKNSEFVVRKWDTEMCDIKSELVSEEEIVNLKDNIMVLDKFLGPYPYDTLKKWTSLTSHFTDNLIKKLSPESGQVRSALDLESCSDVDRPRKGQHMLEEDSTSSNPTKRCLSKDFENALLPNLKPFPGTELKLSTFPRCPYPDGSTPAEITRHSLDSSFVLEEIIAQHSSETDVIGELQFSYICFLVGQSLEAFEHWKNLVSVICSCDVAVKKYRLVYDLFISTLEAQILETPEEFLADITTNNNIIYMKLRELFRTVNDSDIDGRLKTKVERFKQKLTSVYTWDFTHLDSDDEDEAPVVVDVSQ